MDANKYLLLFLVLFGLACAIIAGVKKRNPVLWFLFGALLQFIALATVIGVSSKRRDDRWEPAQNCYGKDVEEQELNKYLSFFESLPKTDTVKCRSCGSTKIESKENVYYSVKEKSPADSINIAKYEPPRKRPYHGWISFLVCLPFFVLMLISVQELRYAINAGDMELMYFYIYVLSGFCILLVLQYVRQLRSLKSCVRYNRKDRVIKRLHWENTICCSDCKKEYLNREIPDNS